MFQGLIDSFVSFFSQVWGHYVKEIEEPGDSRWFIFTSCNVFAAIAPHIHFITQLLQLNAYITFSVSVLNSFILTSKVVLEINVIF